MQKVNIPADRPVFDGEIATYWFEEGILVSLSKAVKRTVANISGNVALVKELTGGTRVPLLIYLTKSPVPDKATRKLSAEMLAVNYKAMAMISEPGLALLIMKIVFKLKPSPIPVKSFTNDHDAKAWLKQFV
ncbi:MAG: STAS/SEC14 domain-containing protein [Niabella sp.]|nr:STAS/SEC14 domain-containing protein [Niabella sp.]